jgi:hypothetical protein
MADASYQKLMSTDATSPQETIIERTFSLSAKHLAIIVTTIVTAVIVSVIVLALATTNFGLNVRERKNEIATVRKILNLQNHTGPYCLHFQSLDTTLAYWLSVDEEETYVTLQVMQWYNSRYYSLKNLPEEVVTLAVYDPENFYDQSVYMWNTSMSQQLTVGAILFDANKVPTNLVPIASLDIGESIVEHASDSLFNVVYRVMEGVVPITRNHNLDVLLAVNGLSQYEIKQNISLSQTSETCNNFMHVPPVRTIVIGRSIEDNSIPVISIMLLIIMLLFLFFRKVQPTRSRLPLLPINAGLLLFLYSFNNLLGIVTNHYFMHKNSKVTRINSAYIFVHQLLQIFTPFCMLTYTCHICRYYYLKYLYARLARRSDISSNNFTMHRRLTSNTAFLIYAIILLLLILIVFIPLEVRVHQALQEGAFARSKSWKLGSSTIAEAIYLLVTLFVSLCLLMEFVLNWRLFKEQTPYTALSYFFHVKDPFYFRLEMLLFMFLIPIFHIEYGLLVGRYYQLQNIEFFSNHASAFDSRVDIVVSIFRIIITFVICGGAVLSIQIGRSLWWNTCVTGNKKKYSERIVTSEIENILLDETGYALMSEFCEKEWSTENLIAWKYIYPIKLSGNVKGPHVVEIYNMFIKSGAEMELNLPKKTKKAMMDKIGPNGLYIVPVMDYDQSFHGLYSQVLINLSDTLSRLMTSPEYHRFEHSKTLLTQNYSLNEIVFK